MRGLAFALSALLVVSMEPAFAAASYREAPVQLDSAKAYVLVRMGERIPGLWNTLTLSPYDETAQDIRGKGRAQGNSMPARTDRSVTVGAGGQIAEANHVRTYLMELTPGRYVLSDSPTTCFCLGSYQFEAGAGKITDLGLIYIGAENGSSPWAVISRIRSSPDIEDRGYTVADAMAIYPWRPSMPDPAGIAALPREGAVYTAAPRFGNHNGHLLNRALPLVTGQ